MNEPLAIKMRPNKLSEVIGQTHLIGKDKILTNLIKNKKLFSMILYGIPGVGKTSIAYALANELGLKYKMLNAVINNKKDFDIAVEEAKLNNGLIIIMDELHRLNKDKQDLLLPYLESGLITLIGITSSNPYHKINPAIRSRCQIFEVKPLDEKDIESGLKRIIKFKILPKLTIDKESINYIIKLSSSDLRFAYNLLEVAYYSVMDGKVNIETLKKINSKPAFIHDKNGDGHYNVLSAFQKSIRGSDVDAALHYLSRLIYADDLDSIIRRMSVIVFEDIGLANPSLCTEVMASINSAERLGFPEARIPLSFAVIEMCLSPKSNTAEESIDNAIRDLEKGNVGLIPNHIKNKPNSGYKYPHSYPNGHVAQQYLPDNIKNAKYFKGKTTSKYEKNLIAIYNKLHEKKQGN